MRTTPQKTTSDQERESYFAGDLDRANLLGRIDSLQRALGQAVATLEEIVKMPERRRPGAAVETLATIEQLTQGDY